MGPDYYKSNPDNPNYRDPRTWTGKVGPAVSPPGTTPGSSASTLPRNARNNNPGNIKYGDFARQHGAIGQDANGFAIFPDMTTGFAATQALLQRYGQHGRNTARMIVNRWAPASDHNNVGSYMNALDGGGNPDSAFDMNDPATLVALSKKIAQHEGLPSSLLGAANGTRLGMAAKRDVTVHQHTEIKVTGADNPARVGREVAGHQSRVNGDLVRNLKGNLS